MSILSLPIVSNSLPLQFHKAKDYLPRAAERRGKQTLQALVEVVPPKEVYVHEAVPEKEAPACNKFYQILFQLGYLRPTAIIPFNQNKVVVPIDEISVYYTGFKLLEKIS